MHDTLSAAGVLRREAMRAMLVGAVVHRRGRRRALRVAVAAALLAGAVLWFAESERPREQPIVVGPATPLIQVIGNDPSVLARLSCGGPATSVEFLDDLSLVAELSQNGREAGLVRSRGRAEVLPRIDDDWQSVQ